MQDVVAHSRHLTRKAAPIAPNSALGRKETFYLNGDPSSDTLRSGTTGLKALRKESRERLDAYQHLFHLLQTRPQYLARLVFAMPQVRTNKFLESVILTLYNFGSNRREEYLLLKLFQVSNNRFKRIILVLLIYSLSTRSKKRCRVRLTS